MFITKWHKQKINIFSHASNAKFSSFPHLPSHIAWVFPKLTETHTKSCATLQYPKIRLHFKLYPIFEPQPSADKAITYESALNNSVVLPWGNVLMIIFLFKVVLFLHCVVFALKGPSKFRTPYSNVCSVAYWNEVKVLKLLTNFLLDYTFRSDTWRQLYLIKPVCFTDG